MRRLQSIAGLRQHLLRRGLPAGYVLRVTRELEEHRNDLLEELHEQGVMGPEAEARVAERMGGLDEIAGRLTKSVRRSTWCGRHAVVTFCLLPLLSFILGFALLLAIVTGITRVAGWEELKPTLSPTQWAMITGSVHGLLWSLFTVIPFGFCRLARRLFCGYGWGLVTCVVFSVHGLLHRFQITAPMEGGHGSILWGYSTHPHWAGMAVPLLVFALFYLHSQRTDASEMRLEQASA